MGEGKQFTLFDFPKLLFSKEKPHWDDLSSSQQKIWSSFMVNRMFAMSDKYLGVSDIINEHLNNLPSKAVYEIWREMLPSKNEWIPYIRKKGKEISNKNYTTKLIKFLAKENELSTREIEDYLIFVDELDMETYLGNYGYTLKDFK